MTLKLTLGADPEFFVFKKDDPSYGVVPACGLFGGTKRNPVMLSPNGGYLEDGAAVEFNVAPASSFSELRNRIFEHVTLFKNRFPEYEIYGPSAASFDPKLLKSTPQLQVIACEADLYAYGLRNKPQINKFGHRRFAGGHIHIGIDPWPENLSKKAVIQYLDAVLYYRCIRVHGANIYRYAFYGYPGLYRETSYGVEYRSPDNWWCNPNYGKVGVVGDVVIPMWDNVIEELKEMLEKSPSIFEHSFNSFMEMTGYGNTFRGQKVQNKSDNFVNWEPAASEIQRRLHLKVVGR